MNRRVVLFFSFFICILVVLIVWLMNVTFSDEYILAGNSQSMHTLTVYTTRGKIYDRNMLVIAGGSAEYKAIVRPSAKTTSRLISELDNKTVDDLEEKLKGSRPFVIKVPDSFSSGEDIDVVKCIKRYSDEAIAPNIVGYLDSEGKGVCGIEKAYEKILDEYEGEYKITYRVNALGESLEKEPIIRDTTNNSNGGVVLTIDSSIQLIAQRAAEQYLESGVIVIMDTGTGEILACVSAPVFNQNKISEYLYDEGDALVNKSFSSYDIGSVFKLVVSAGAIESGYGDFEYCCKGTVEIGNKNFKCSNISGHGTVDMEQALAYSCNCYFIELSKNVGYKNILEKAKLLGFGRAVELGENFRTGKGHLPDENELSLPAGLANFSFGQGSLMANPVQVAGMISCIANDGVYIKPSIVRCTVNSRLEKTGDYSNCYKYEAMDKSTAEFLKKSMEAVMKYGTGKSVSSQIVSMAGKSGTAETGICINGRKIKRGWFAGYFPADDPEYVCVILSEDADSGTASAGPCFKFIAERISHIYGK